MDVKKENASKTVAVVGGGAAGLFAAYFAKLKNPGNRVILIDKNAYLGAKVLISGGGRCNLTTGITNVRDLLQNYPRGAGFLRTAMENFPPEAVMSWFETQGVALKTEPDLRVFPVSNNGHDIVNALTDALNEAGVEIFLDTAVTDLTTTPAADEKNTSAPSVYTLTFKNRAPLIANQVILTTGGNAYRHTGSSGDGYSFAQKLGHTITPLAPSLTSFRTAEEWSHQLSGNSFPKVTLSLENDSKKSSTKTSPAQQKHQRTGAFLFTHQGITGPAVFALSGLAAFEELTPEHPRRLTINFFPGLSPTQLSLKLDEIISANPKKHLENLLAILVPHSISAVLVENFLNIDKSLQATHLKKTFREQIVHLLQNLPLTVIGRGVGEEMVTAGGVSLDEVNPATMESRLRRGLFFAGELLDIDGFTGGFNLQASWATGALAGEST